ncbi:MAG: hypothetical protein JW744_00800 [Candidatus Diapherotrites archaeon]|uniref:Uncharacterized protein n=1 Tax=Candidatus Iainarchaeum sp. TaxID=3101447 RepID=A0A938YX77_9ARCH|nr:hypothetical protein [Candidatus Diapherotrites archaeon]
MKILKYTLSILFCNAYRLLRFIPNNDPIMGVMLPYSKQGKWWHAALFAFITMLSFDFITSGIGIWTWATAFTYAGLGLLFHFTYRRIKVVKLKHYMGSGILGVLIFDFVTGVVLGPTMFGMSYLQALIGQIPFTAMHLITVSGFILILTPLLDRAVISNPALEDSTVVSKLKMAVRA